MILREQIEEIVNRETGAWDSQDVDLLLSVFHPDMVWPWPPTANSHDPEDWVNGNGAIRSPALGRFLAGVVCDFQAGPQPPTNSPNRNLTRRRWCVCRGRHRYIAAREEWHNIALEGTRLQSVCESRR